MDSNKEKVVVDAIEEVAVLPGNNTLVPLTASALQYFEPEKQKEIMAVAQAVDVLQIEKVMSFGQIPLLRSFEQAGKILKAEEGSSVDQEVIRQVVELSKQANESYDDFNLELREPGLVQKIYMKLVASAKDKRTNEVKVKALTNYKLLQQLATSCDEWIAMLEQGYRQIVSSAKDDENNSIELEEYIVAGRVAEERIAGEVAAAKERYDASGLREDKRDYENLDKGLSIFRTVLLNLEKSRAAFDISKTQLTLQAKANENIQVAVRSQRANSMALAAQQLRNAVLDAKNRQALEGQKSITRLNDELMKKVATNSVLTAEESEKILLSGVYTVEAALIAARTVIDGCEEIKKARSERNVAITSEMEKLKNLFDELTPFVDDIKEITEKNGNESKKTTPTGKLVF